MPKRVLIVESGIYASQTLARFFEEREDEVWHAWKLEEAASLLDLVQPDIMLMDIHFPGDGWLKFLSQSQEKNPNLKIIITTKQIDLRREILAKQHGVEVFVRQPYTRHWLEQALLNVESTQPIGRSSVTQTPSLPPVYISMRVKIILPFLLVVFILAFLSYFMNSRLLDQFNHVVYQEQLKRSSIQTANWLASVEKEMLTSLRQISNTEGVPEGISRRNSDQLANIIKPVMVNNGETAVETLDLKGRDVFSWYRDGEITALSDDNAFWTQQQSVLMALKGIADRKGDKYVLLIESPRGNFIYLCGPVYADNQQPQGVLLIGRSISALLSDLKQSLLVDASLYNLEGKLLNSTLQDYTAADIPQDKILSMIQDQQTTALTRGINLAGENRLELLFPWRVREGETIGFVGISTGFPAPFIETALPWRLGMIAVLVVAILLIWWVGDRVAVMFLKPVRKLTTSMLEVNQGNLITKVESSGNDELSVLVHSFNVMLLGFQQKLIYRDLMGYMPAAETCERMRRTFDSHDFNLRGYEANVTVLVTDVHHFTQTSRNLLPEKMIEALNEYFEPLAQIAASFDGIIHQPDNDSLMVIFGALPDRLSPQEGALNACHAAAAMLASVGMFNKKLQQNGFEPFSTGIGIHSGQIVLGGLSIRDQIHYTPVGNTVKIAHYLEQIGRKAGVPDGVFVSQDTVDLLDEHQNEFELDCLGQFSLKPDHQLSFVYRLIPSRERII